VELKVVPIENPEGLNVILGQTHFIKTVEDLHETLVTAIPGIKFGLAFCEASGPALIRRSGTDEKLTQLAVRNAQAIGAGRCGNRRRYRHPQGVSAPDRLQAVDHSVTARWVPSRLAIGNHLVLRGPHNEMFKVRRYAADYPGLAELEIPGPSTD